MPEIWRNRVPGRQRAVAALCQVFDVLLLWQQRHSERRSPSTFSDHMLEDIGVSRADVDREVRKTFWRP